MCNDLRRQQVTSLDDYVLAAGRGLAFTGLVNGLVGHARRALSSPETEIAKDEWDLTVFGHSGTVAFTGISQPWLREAAKRWAADDLPKRGCAGRRTSAGCACVTTSAAWRGCRSRCGCAPTAASIPAALGRADMEAFLHRLAFLESVGQISGDARIRACREVRARADPHPGTGADPTRRRSPPDWARTSCSAPATSPPNPNRPNPAGTCRRRSCGSSAAHLDELTSPEMRTAIELAIDTGRRPEEICELGFDCLTRDDDGQPVLVYDNHKANRLGRRLPISEPTAALIIAQQQRVRGPLPGHPDRRAEAAAHRPAQPRRAPRDHRASASRSRTAPGSSRCRALRTADGIEFDKTKIVPYAYRHTYAQRHADAGVPVEVLRELMDRTANSTPPAATTESAKPAAAKPSTGSPRCSSTGTATASGGKPRRCWTPNTPAAPSARSPSRSASAPNRPTSRPAAAPAPSGSAAPAATTSAPTSPTCPTCTPTSTTCSATANACSPPPISTTGHGPRRCPSEEEISRIRRLIDRISTGLDDLTPTSGSQIEQAVTAVRRHRTVMLGMPRIRQALPDLRPERTP